MTKKIPHETCIVLDLTLVFQGPTKGVATVSLYTGTFYKLMRWVNFNMGSKNQPSLLQKTKQKNNEIT